VRRTRRSDQDRDRQSIGENLDHLIGDIRRIEVRHDQDIGRTSSRECGNTSWRDSAVSAESPCISPSASISGWSFTKISWRGASSARSGIVAAEIGMRQERDLRLDAEALHMDSGERRHFRQFLGGRIGPDLGIGDEIRSLLVITSASAE
jgi:hypothetical protein